MLKLIRLLIPLMLTLAALAYVSVFAFDRLTLRWFVRDIDARSRLAATASRSALVQAIKRQSLPAIESLLTEVTKDERLYALGFCNLDGNLASSTQFFTSVADCSFGSEGGEIHKAAGAFHLTPVAVEDQGRILGTLFFVHDMSFALQRSATTSRYIYLVFLVLGVLIAGVTLCIFHFTWRSWVKGVRMVIREKGLLSALPASSANEWLPIVRELRSLIGELESDKKLQSGARIVWDSKTLKELLATRLSGDEIIIVSNREPYIHNATKKGVEVQRPASGLVTALEPVMQACSGTWVAHGSGSADRQVVDAHDRIWVPPGEGSYQIRRVWLSEEEEKGYYYGFANEGIWPLCHIAHTRPIFRSCDWEHYKNVNARFADVVIEEARSDAPVILVQDYHFAMLPEMIKARLPKATILTFWHIPWPNAEAFGICPWRDEILRGLLGSTILGFHTRYHRNNFLDTVDRFVECRIDREAFTVHLQDKLTAVRNYPISIEWPPKWQDTTMSAKDCRSEVLKRHELGPDVRLAIGVERLDYTKGLLERFAAVSRLFELHPEWIGKFSLIQIAAPSREPIETYSRFADSVEQAAERINRLYSSAAAPPILFLKQHHDHRSLDEYMRAADVCLVTSLHDGMNLVAKEFIASRTDELGILILSMFAGASRELPEALIVNPYNADQCAEAIHLALQMSEDEQRYRMTSMREQVKEFNVYRWAGRMLVDAAQMRERNRLSDQLFEASMHS